MCLKLRLNIVLTKPTSVEPVKATLSISMWLDIAAPAVGPYPGIMLTTPFGNPAFGQQIVSYDWMKPNTQSPILRLWIRIGHFVKAYCRENKIDQSFLWSSRKL